MDTLSSGCFDSKKVLVTGHTGFKGSWLSLWLSQLGVEVYGYSLPSPEESHYRIADVRGILHGEVLADIREKDRLSHLITDVQPDVIFHLAAQPLVRYSYSHPAETFDVNVMGTVSLLEAVRRAGRPVILIIVTSDKCYSTDVEVFCFREEDRLGGIDPYSASKAAVEIISDSYRRSYFPPERYDEHRIALATVRAGNVIGGGDFASDRIIPDLFRSIVAGRSVDLRNPHAVRPWQHVLEPLAGYLMLAAALMKTPTPSLCSAFNFGPDISDTLTVMEIVELFQDLWPGTCDCPVVHPQAFHETRILQLDAKKSMDMLGWRPVWTTREAVEMTARWYHDYYCGGISGPSRSIADITAYMDRLSYE
ncbi:CDP-glucose 4,6-dehydratase [Methanospirillum sp. J.3.6.1-F.2.7.3]|uniref:CDP-glucose 4,6-dehydratase n=1 Tax=Methanospirillum purgamenti TaxID=2834276 RepID=A0A8E7EHL8_9EURY|nr:MULTISPECIES: CDP-glucose 4,6-dehydratase [Methanospirillum]MDX8551842.1 CDP-glucose 4,6-dehydratase [Methanospirillum hungatei]QVV89142.1 CDP-glucose 4,6-dehydratase [Methanospirillum sp. J.3.6.1-F.2.7.3]